MTLNEKECKHIMQPIVKFGLAKAEISSNLHTSVIYGPRSLGGIGLSDPFFIQVTSRIAFLIEHHWKSTPYSPLIWANLSTLQLKLGGIGCILENDYTETQQWLYTESWILDVWKLILENQINISHLVPEVAIQRTHNACLMTHLA